MSSFQPERRAPGRRVLFVAALAILVAFPALAQSPDAAQPAAGGFVPHDVQLRALKQLQRDMLFQGARRRMAAARERLRQERELKKRGVAPKRGVHARKVKESEEGLLGPRDVERRVVMASVENTAAVPTNVRVNNPAGDAATAGQADRGLLRPRSRLPSLALAALATTRGPLVPCRNDDPREGFVNGGNVGQGNEDRRKG